MEGHPPRIRREHRRIGPRQGGAKVLGGANTSITLLSKRDVCGVSHHAAARSAAPRHTNVRRCARGRPLRKESPMTASGAGHVSTLLDPTRVNRRKGGGRTEKVRQGRTVER